MTVFTEGRHAAEFLLSEANGQRSRESITVKSGENLAAGQLIELSGGEAVAASGDLESDGTLTTALVGILLYPVDATDGAVAKCAYLARDAEVNDNLVTYPTESTAGGEKAACIASLKALGIIVR